jgi:hypothetical protein
MDKTENALFTRIVDLKYILQGAAKYSTESTDSPVEHILNTDYFNSDKIEDLTRVKRLPKSQSNKGDNLRELPFNRNRTKACRVTLADYYYSKLYF